MSKKVLIVDDEIPIRDIVSAVLQQMNIESIHAGTGQEALKLAVENKNDINLVVLDMNLPEMSGEETFTELNMVLPGCAYIFTSGYDLSDACAKLNPASNARFIKKPFALSDLKSQILELVG